MTKQGLDKDQLERIEYALKMGCEVMISFYGEDPSLSATHDQHKMQSTRAFVANILPEDTLLIAFKESVTLKSEFAWVDKKKSAMTDHPRCHYLSFPVPYSCRIRVKSTNLRNVLIDWPVACKMIETTSVDTKGATNQ